MTTTHFVQPRTSILENKIMAPRIPLNVVNPEFNNNADTQAEAASSEATKLRSRAEGGDIFEEIKKEITENRVVLYMKGTPQAPACGFSMRVVQILHQVGLPEYGAVNILVDPEKRQGIKEFSDWPTIPQLYVDGEFIGGCDIVTDMFQSGELAEVLGLS